MPTPDPAHLTALGRCLDGLARCRAEIADLHQQARDKRREEREWERKRQEAEAVLLGRAAPTLFDADAITDDTPLAALPGFPRGLDAAGRVTVGGFRELLAPEVDAGRELAAAVYAACELLPGVTPKSAAAVADAVLPAVAAD